MNPRAVLSRLLDYLELAGVEVDEQLLFRLTALLQEGVARGISRGALFDWCRDRLDGRLNGAPPPPAPMPPILRGSIGYGHRR